VALAGTRVTVVGHTDTTGSASLNLVLSQARAQTVVDELVARGVPAEQVVAVGAGEREPVVVAGVEDEAASRRVVIGVEVVDG
jgi:OOP family OmpA-OmpF porin